LYIVGAIL